MMALLRLIVWRPPWLLGLLLVLASPALLTPQLVLSAYMEDRAFWLLSALVWIMVTGGVGMLVAVSRHQLQQAPFSWSLPDLRRRLLVGTVGVGAVVAAPLLLLPGLELPLRLAAYALALFAFFVAGPLFDAIEKRAWVDVLFILGLLALMWTGPGRAAGTAYELVARWPLAAGTAVAVVAATASVLILRSQFSAGTARSRVQRWSSPGSMAAFHWQTRREHRREWTGSLATDRLGPWLRATEWEGDENGTRLSLGLVFFVALIAVLFHAMGEPFFIVVMLCSLFVMLGFHLDSGLLYPLSRARRARLAAWGGTIQAGAAGALTLVLILGLDALGVPTRAREPEFPYSPWLALGLAVALAPMAQWATIRWGPPRWGPNRGRATRGGSVRSRGWSEAGRLGLFLAYVVTVVAAAYLLTGAPTLVVAAVVLATALVMQVAFHAAVRRHWARKDQA